MGRRASPVTSPTSEQQPRGGRGCSHKRGRTGRRLGGPDGRVLFLDVTTGQLLREGDSGDRAWSVALHPNGKLAASGGDSGTVRLWEFPSGRPLGPAGE